VISVRQVVFPLIILCMAEGNPHSYTLLGARWSEGYAAVSSVAVGLTAGSELCAKHLATLKPNHDWYPPSIFFLGMKYMVYGDPALRWPGPER
jgi:hypothetical protein